MRWQDQPRACRLYVLFVCLVSLPFAVSCLGNPTDYSSEWLLLTLASAFVATINVRLPKLSAIISMGDVFVLLVLMRFGCGPALLTYWIDNTIGYTADIVRRYRRHAAHQFHFYQLAFNLACCALSTWLMYAVYRGVLSLNLAYPLGTIIALFSVALAWFLVNTGTLSMALALTANRSFWSVWQQGVVLYLLNFLGSAATAGLVSVFYERAGFLIFLLCIPIVVVFYQLYRFNIEKYDQAQTHIADLNKLYLQTVEALATAVDAKDRYTHGHIRRVQAYATKLAILSGLNEENQLLAIKTGALLHDIGKIAIPEYILNKPTALTETEYEKMKIHPVVGANMLSTIEFPFPLLELVKSHHERWDGNGYPDGLRAEEIPVSARILSLVDCYDALTTNRPYRSPMSRREVVEFFQRESGRAYDPAIVRLFIDNLEEIESAGSTVVIETDDVWGIKETSTSGRKLEKVQPTLAYGKALNTEPAIQRELYSVFEFARADFQCLKPIEIFSFMGRKLQGLLDFDAAVFYEADLTQGAINATYTAGADGASLSGVSLKLEQKLSGWVAANNQALCNLPPFPDFLNRPEPKPAFQVSAIVPLNRQGEVLGAISLYRKHATKFTEEEFRRLEIVASQTSVLLSKCKNFTTATPLLFDHLTNLPNAFNLYLMFDSVAMDAGRYEYPLAILSLHFDDLKTIRQKWGPMSGDEAVRAAAGYLTRELRDTDVLVRYANDEFVVISPKMSREGAENLRSRLQNELDHFRFAVRAMVEIPLHTSVGIALFPEDGQDLETLLSVAEWHLRQDRELRSAVKHAVRVANMPD